MTLLYYTFNNLCVIFFTFQSSLCINSQSIHISVGMVRSSVQDVPLSSSIAAGFIPQQAWPAPRSSHPNTDDLPVVGGNLAFSSLPRLVVTLYCELQTEMTAFPFKRIRNWYLMTVYQGG
ncbi:Uncharacterised protein [Chlamydia abortus]|nr:Uncharacterised protein [Chlamydia abortus]